MRRVTVIGSSNTDMVVRMERIPKPGETLLGGKFFTYAGGKGANQAVAVKRAGGDLFFLSKLGLDSFGDETVKHFKREGITIEGVLRDSKTASGVALITVSKEGQNSIAVAPGANMSLSTRDIQKFKSVIAESKVVLLQLETPVATVLEAAKLAKSNNCAVILNPAPAIKLPVNLYRYIDYITPNEHEAELMTGIKIKTRADAEKAAQKIKKFGVNTVIITLGAKGVYCVGPFGSCFQPSFKVKAVDTTAAGDTFNGAFAVAIAERMELTQALRFACGAAALSVTKKGAQESIPFRKAIERITKLG
ncbi:MAG: ribokinase [Fibrobacteres bacterium]|nr:ribokinase [Fibrobacterota bacterium]